MPTRQKNDVRRPTFDMPTSDFGIALSIPFVYFVKALRALSGKKSSFHRHPISNLCKSC